MTRGKLIRVTASGWKSITDKHGSLWVVSHQCWDTSAYECKSIATGFTFPWFDDQIEIAEEGAE
jgi:hypothetical protein